MTAYSYRTSGVCSRQIDLELNGDIIEHVSFVSGCNGNLKAIGRLVAGKNAEEIADLLEGNTCGSRSTSCADQLAHALREAHAAELAARTEH